MVERDCLLEETGFAYLFTANLDWTERPARAIDEPLKASGSGADAQDEGHSRDLARRPLDELLDDGVGLLAVRLALQDATMSFVNDYKEVIGRCANRVMDRFPQRVGPLVTVADKGVRRGQFLDVQEVNVAVREAFAIEGWADYGDVGVRQAGGRLQHLP